MLVIGDESTLPKNFRDLKKLGITRRKFRQVGIYLARAGELDGLTRHQRIAVIVETLSFGDDTIPKDSWDWDKFLEAVDAIMEWVMKIIELFM